MCLMWSSSPTQEHALAVHRDDRKSPKYLRGGGEGIDESAGRGQRTQRSGPFAADVTVGSGKKGAREPAGGRDGIMTEAKSGRVV